LRRRRGDLRRGELEVAARPTLSVCCIAGGSLARVAAVLSQYDDIADEIVCAVDARVSIDQLDLLRSHADVVVRCDVSPVTGVERNLAWLHGLCHGSWVLRIDSDESASAPLLAALPEMIRADDTLQYVLPRRWLFPDALHWINEEPWSCDWQIRMVRNLPLMRFLGVQHSTVDVVLPQRYVDAPIYHLDLIASSKEERVAKSERYERRRPGLRTEQGHPVNNFYLPERFQTQPSLPVPNRDQLLIDQIVGNRFVDSSTGGPGRRWSTGSKPPYYRMDEIDRTWCGRDVPESAYRATWLSWPCVAPMHTDELRSIFVAVRNDGTERWPWGEAQPEIRLATRWLTRDGSSMRFNSIRTSFTADVPPGSIVRQPMTLQAPPEPGEYLLELDLVHEFVRWFGCTVHMPVTVGC